MRHLTMSPSRRNNFMWLTDSRWNIGARAETVLLDDQSTTSCKVLNLLSCEITTAMESSVLPENNFSIHYSCGPSPFCTSIFSSNRISFPVNAASIPVLLRHATRLPSGLQEAHGKSPSLPGMESGRKSSQRACGCCGPSKNW